MTEDSVPNNSTHSLTWAHKKRNKIASGIKLFFYSSTITRNHSQINIENFVAKDQGHFLIDVVVSKNRKNICQYFY